MNDKLVLPSRLYLNGPMCSGKGVIAEQLVRRGWVEIAYSDAVYEAVAEAEGVSVEWIRDHKADFRSKLQNLGHGRRGEDPLYWINERERRASRYRFTVESGTRYANEAETAMGLGGVVVRVETPLFIRRERYFQAHGSYPTPEQEAHPSETTPVPHNFVISGYLKRYEIIPELARLYAKWLDDGQPIIRP
jgi:hypothetical protein